MERAIIKKTLNHYCLVILIILFSDVSTRDTSEGSRDVELVAWAEEVAVAPGANTRAGPVPVPLPSPPEGAPLIFSRLKLKKR
jgi:hypothetical protein